MQTQGQVGKEWQRIPLKWVEENEEKGQKGGKRETEIEIKIQTKKQRVREIDREKWRQTEVEREKKH